MSSPRSQLENEPNAFTRAGTDRQDFVCAVCGYNISVSEPPSQCPMCNQSAWRADRPGIAARLARVVSGRWPHEQARG